MHKDLNYQVGGRALSSGKAMFEIIYKYRLKAKLEVFIQL